MLKDVALSVKANTLSLAEEKAKESRTDYSRVIVELKPGNFIQANRN